MSIAPDGLSENLTELRHNGHQRHLVIAGGVFVGLGLGSVHWLGLVIGGALVALPARTVPRGIAYGVGLGVLGLAVFVVMLAIQGALGPAVSTGVVFGVGLAVGLGAPVLGSLTRAVV